MNKLRDNMQLVQGKRKKRIIKGIAKPNIIKQKFGLLLMTGRGLYSLD